MTPHALAGLRPPVGLAGTRRPHLCPRCAFYAYHNDRPPVQIGMRVHHPACAIVRGPQPRPPHAVETLADPILVRARVGSDADPPGDAPSPLPILATAIGIFVATLNIAKSKGP